MLKNRILYVLAVAGSAAFYIAYEEWISWIILAALLMLAPLSLAFSLRAMLKTRITLDLPERVPQGAELTLAVEAHCPVAIPPYRCKIKITKPITGEVLSLRADDALPTEHCGALNVSAADTVVYDHLGIFGFKVRKAPSAIVRVMPKSKELPLPEEFKGLLARSMRAKRGGGFSENHEIRPYIPGDTLNLIHWKLSAKADELMLREPVEPELGTLMLTLDIKGSPEELDRRFCRLFRYGGFLLEHGIAFEVLALTANGIEAHTVREASDFHTCTDLLLNAPFAPSGTVAEHRANALWRCHIGGEPYEA